MFSPQKTELGFQLNGILRAIQEEGKTPNESRDSESTMFLKPTSALCAVLGIFQWTRRDSRGVRQCSGSVRESPSSSYGHNSARRSCRFGRRRKCSLVMV